MAISTYEEDGKLFWKVYVNLRSKIDFHIRVQKHSLGFETEIAAIAEEKRLLRSLGEKLARLESQGFIWETILEQWEFYQKNEVRLHPTTIQDQISMVRNWTESWLNRSASELNRGDAREIFKNMEARGKSKSLQRNLKSAINSIYNWGLEEKLIRNATHSPVHDIQIQKVRDETPPEILNLEEIRRFLSLAKQHEHKWYPVWVTALLTGARSGELFALRWSDVDFANRKITISKSYNGRERREKCTKAGYWRTVPISPELYTFLSDLRVKSQESEYALPRFWEWQKGDQARVLRTFAEGVGLKSVKFHTLRACFATQLLSHSVAPATVMKICGWKDLKTMQRYIRMAGIDEKGATDCLTVLASDTEVMGKVVNLFEFRAKEE